jgi:hypothetical protein
MVEDGDVPKCLEIEKAVWTTIVEVKRHYPRNGEKGVQTHDEDTAEPAA